MLSSLLPLVPTEGYSSQHLYRRYRFIKSEPHINSKPWMFQGPKAKLGADKPFARLVTSTEW